MYLLVAYDISSDKRRTKLSDLLSGYGIRVNYSVFEIEISKVKFKKLLSKIKKIVKKEDSIRVYHLNKDVIKNSFILNSNKKVFETNELYF